MNENDRKNQELILQINRVMTDDIEDQKDPPQDTEDELNCAFCNCGKNSLLGQGKLKRYVSTPGFNSVQAARSASRKIRASSIKLRDRSRTSSIENLRTSNVLLQNTINDLNKIGHNRDVDVLALLNKAGEVVAHSCCAAWADSTESDKLTIRFVDKAVVKAVSQACSYCSMHGAAVKCKQDNCAKYYHYPCAAASGCFQDIKSLTLLCPMHIEYAEIISGQGSFCVECQLPGQISDQLYCTSCGQHYHGTCLSPAVEVNAVVRGGWQCPECKICQNCRRSEPGDDNRMLVCDTCDKGYHTFCLQPSMSSIPQNGWKCTNCRVCVHCSMQKPGNRISSQWHHNYSVCDACFVHRRRQRMPEPEGACPLCRLMHDDDDDDGQGDEQPFCVTCERSVIL